MPRARVLAPVVIGGVVLAAVGLGWAASDRVPEPADAAEQDDVVLEVDVADGEATTSGEPGPVIEEPGLPAYHEMPAEILEQAGRGWVVTVHRPATDPGSPPAAHAVFVVAPDGTHYLAARLDPEVTVRLLRWHVRDPRVLVAVSDAAEVSDGASAEPLSAQVAWLDLGPGELADATGLSGSERAALLETEVISEPGGTMSFSPGAGAWWSTGVHRTTPDGSTDVQVPPAVSGGTSGSDYATASCAPTGWLDGSRLLALCIDRDALRGRYTESWQQHTFLGELEPSLAELTVAADGEIRTTPLRALATGEPLPEPFAGVWVRDGVVAAPALDGTALGCHTGVGLWTESTPTRLQGPGERGEGVFRVAAQDGVVYVEAGVGCAAGAGVAGVAASATLTAHDLATGATTILAPAPAPTSDGHGYTVGLVDWTVAR